MAKAALLCFLLCYSLRERAIHRSRGGECVKGMDWDGDEFVGLMRLAIAGNSQGKSVLEGEAEKGAFSFECLYLVGGG
jgi:hypothetical protein